MARFVLSVVVFLLLNSVSLPAWAVDPYAGNDPHWILIHEPAVLAELKLSREQAGSLQKLTDELDLKFFPLRNRPAEEATRQIVDVTTRARAEADSILLPAQKKRLNEILLQRLGSAALLQPDVSGKLRYSAGQREKLEEIVNKTNLAVAEIQKNAESGDRLDRKIRDLQSDQQKKLLDVLKPAQRASLQNLFGAPFDHSKLGHPAFKAPELVDSGEWINSPPLTLESLKGRVVVVHFYAFGCINCIHNYPWYREWADRFQGKEVTIIGIHTPETSAERETESVRRKATDEKFTFPILIDGKGGNWNAWGNSMWPSVYVIDQRGYLRYFWPGELKWQGNDGEKLMRERIESLLANPPR